MVRRPMIQAINQVMAARSGSSTNRPKSTSPMICTDCYRPDTAKTTVARRWPLLPVPRSQTAGR
jgi:hypothetical protein